MNTINVISPYKYLDMWVFDDPRAGLVQEPFVSGADAMIDRAVANIADADRGFLMLFSASPFPGYEHHLKWFRSDLGGNWYYSEKYELEGWLCPALFKYFEHAPKEMFFQCKAKAS